MNYGLINFLENKPSSNKKFDNFFQKLMYLNKKDYNVNILIVGRNRVGKTYSAISLAYALNKFFDNGIVESWDSSNPKRFWIFGLMDLLEMLNTTLKEIDKPIWLVYEEAGESLGAMEWYSLPNRIFAKITQTWGSKKINLIITLPKSRELSSGAIAQIHYGIEIKARGIGLLCKANHVYLTSSKKLKDLYFEPISIIQFEKPRRKILNYYERDKFKFQEVSYKQYENELRAFTNLEKKRIEKQLTTEKEYSFSGANFKFS